MASTILPSGEEIFLTPDEIKRYLNVDGLRQLLRHERNHFNLKPNKDADFYSVSTLYKYSGDLHNEGDHQLIEVRTFPDNGAKAGYAGIHIDGGEFGYIHNHEKWDEAVTEESAEAISNRVSIGVTQPRDEINPPYSHDSDAREASMLFDSYDGRAYLLSNDECWYVNNDKRDPSTKLPLRTAARIVDIPTKITDLENDLDFVADWNYIHTDNNFSHANRYMLDNMDDRTFVYPEISKDSNGSYVPNMFVGLTGEKNYAESDGSENNTNIQQDYENDREGAANSSYNKNINDQQEAGYFPGIFKSIEELEKVDLLRQKKTRPLDPLTPFWKRTDYFYKYDGLFNHNMYDRDSNDDTFKSPNLDPTNSYNDNDSGASQPMPFAVMNQKETEFDYDQLYQWRYNRVTVRWWSDDLSIMVHTPGRDYKIGDLLRYTFMDEVLLFHVDEVDPTNGSILSGHYIPQSENHQFETNPSSNGVAIYFSNFKSTGKNAKFVIVCRPRIHMNATQIKNNLFAYVDVVPTVRSNIQGVDFADDSERLPLSIDNDTGVKGNSTAASPAYSGLNKGRGVKVTSNDLQSSTFKSPLYEHGGNATAGPHIHLFRYILDGSSEIVDGVKVYTGKWVDQGPMGIERPADIKALLFSNPDCNNFNNYYKFMIDIFFDNLYRSPDAVKCNTVGMNPTYTAAFLRIHVDERDPAPDQKVYEQSIGSSDNKVDFIDISDKTLWINAGTRTAFIYNSTVKNDPNYGYGNEPENKWIPIGGTITR